MTTPPSTLVLLDELPNMKNGSKVRFAGRVTSYDTQSGNLTLASPWTAVGADHARTDSDASHKQVLAQIETSHVLSLATTSPRLFETGSDVNVVGYVSYAPPEQGFSSIPPQHRVQSHTENANEKNGTVQGGDVDLPPNTEHEHVFVQALLLWDATSHSLWRRLPAETLPDATTDSKYEAAVRARERAMKSMADAREDEANLNR